MWLSGEDVDDDTGKGDGDAAADDEGEAADEVPEVWIMFGGIHFFGAGLRLNMWQAMK